MSLLQGTVSPKRFLVLGPVPGDAELQDGLEKERFRPFEDGSEEERSGWVDWRNPLIIPADPNWVSQDRFSLFSVRIDTRKVPAAILKARVDLRTQGLMQEKDLAFIGKEARTSIQDEVKAELLQKEQPRLKTVDVAWDRKQGVLWATAGSTKIQGILIGLFMKSFGCELQPLAPLLLAGRLAPQIPVETLMALDTLNLELEEN